MKKKILILLSVLFAGLWIGKSDVQAETATVQYHTQKEIVNYIKENNIDLDAEITYQTKPSTESPYKAGRLSNKTLQSGLNMLNFLRYIAGIDDDVTLNDEYIAKAQAGALVNAVNNSMSHYPVQPDGMDDELYELGYSGTRSSNIAWGYGTLNKAMHGFMEDDCDSNVQTVGHRAWILNEEMLYTGFGEVDHQYCVYAHDMSRTTDDYDNIVWPAQNMPLEYFDSNDPWSVFTDDMQYSNEDTIQVTLVRRSDKKTWTFSNSQADGEFYISGGYGHGGSIIFRPDDIRYNNGDIFDVTITGIASGETLTYTVNFFALNPITGIDFDDSYAIMRGSEGSMWATTLPYEAVAGTVTFTTSNKKVVKIVEQEPGYVRIKGVKAGTATITARCVSGGKTYTKKCTVFVVPTERLWDFVSYWPVVKSAKNTSKKAAKLTWYSYRDASGYQIQMSTKKTSGFKKVATIKKGSTVSYTKKNLTKGKTYYFRVRAYTKYKGKTYYSGWSDVKKVKIRK